MFIAAATVGQHATGTEMIGSMGALGASTMGGFSGSKPSRNRHVDDVSGRQQYTSVHNVMLREIFSMAARLLAVHEVHLCLMLMQAIDKKFGSARVDACNHEDFSGLLQDFVNAEKGKGDDRSVVKELAKKKRDETVPSLEADDRLRHIWKGAGNTTSLKTRSSLDKHEARKDEHKKDKDEKKERRKEASGHPAREDSTSPSKSKSFKKESPTSSKSKTRFSGIDALSARSSAGNRTLEAEDRERQPSVLEISAPSSESQVVDLSRKFGDSEREKEAKGPSTSTDTTEEPLQNSQNSWNRSEAESEECIAPVRPNSFEALPPEEDHLTYLQAEDTPEQERPHRKVSQLDNPFKQQISSGKSSARNSRRGNNQLVARGDITIPSARSSTHSAVCDVDRIAGREAKAIACDNQCMPPPDRIEREIMRQFGSCDLSVEPANSEFLPQGSSRSMQSRDSAAESFKSELSTSQQVNGRNSFKSRTSKESMESMESQLASVGPMPSPSNKALEAQKLDEAPAEGDLEHKICFAQDKDILVYHGSERSNLSQEADGTARYRRSMSEAMATALRRPSSRSEHLAPEDPFHASPSTGSRRALSPMSGTSSRGFQAFGSSSRRQSRSKGANARRESSMWKLQQKLISAAPVLPQWSALGDPLQRMLPALEFGTHARSPNSKDRKVRRRSTRGSISGNIECRRSRTTDDMFFNPTKSNASRHTGTNSASAREFLEVGRMMSAEPSTSSRGEGDGLEEDEDLSLQDEESVYSSDEEDGSSDESSESAFSQDDDDERQLKQWQSGEAKRVSRASRLDAKWKLLHNGGTVAFEDVLEEDTMVLSQPSNPFVMHPDSHFRVLWDICVLLFILFDSFGMSLTLGFDIFLPNEYPWVTSGFFITDIVMSLLTGYIMDGVLVMRQNMIVKNYLFTPSRCVIDILASLPWDAIHNPRTRSDSHFTEALAFDLFVLFFRFMRLLRLLKLRSTVARFEERFTSRGAVLGFVLGKTMVFFVLLCHWCGCIWAFIGTPTKTGFTIIGDPYALDVDCERGGPCEAGIEGSPWMRRYAIENLEFKHQYILALHFAAAVITGNDLSMQPGWWLERLFVSVMMICSFFVCTWMVSQIIVVMQKLRRLHIDFSDQMLGVKDFMTKRSIPVPLQQKVRRYLEYQYENRKARNDNPEFMHHLSPWLQLELRECLHKGVLTRHPFFQQLPEKVLKHICGMASSTYYAPSDVVVQRGQRASSMCFIVRGKLCVLGVPTDNGQGTTHRVMMQPSWIGDMCLFVDMKRTKTVVSVTHSELLVVQKSSVLVLVNEFPKILVSYRNWSKNAQEGNMTACGIVCECCQQYGHAAGDCPEMTSSMRSAQQLAAKEMRRSLLRGKSFSRTSSNWDINGSSASHLQGSDHDQPHVSKTKSNDAEQRGRHSQHAPPQAKWLEPQTQLGNRGSTGSSGSRNSASAVASSIRRMIPQVSNLKGVTSTPVAAARESRGSVRASVHKTEPK